MSLKRWGLAVAVGVAAIVFMTTAASPQSRATGVARFRQTVAVYESQGTYPGANEVWRTTVMLRNRPQTVGSGGIACVHVTATVRECVGTFVLPLGRIQVTGEIVDRHVYQLAIVGGLGSYAGASGVASFSAGLATFFIV